MAHNLCIRVTTSDLGVTSGIWQTTKPLIDILTMCDLSLVFLLLLRTGKRRELCDACAFKFIHLQRFLAFARNVKVLANWLIISIIIGSLVCTRYWTFSVYKLNKWVPSIRRRRLFRSGRPMELRLNQSPEARLSKFIFQCKQKLVGKSESLLIYFLNHWLCFCWFWRTLCLG